MVKGFSPRAFTCLAARYLLQHSSVRRLGSDIEARKTKLVIKPRSCIANVKNTRSENPSRWFKNQVTS
ncbi:t22.12 [Tupaiid betaherpesvirus 1]|uniref:T22.12 n=1 Tax=Tupaiid herpesvirus 1 (strain 1) TaxID=10397 RepID=Q91TS7_TUHV1|nr:t22.12 [Tupaiid betaherpesvirus 1]AAK57060.1 t22.12 [Tupaiid betaherpesvirus 1]